MTCRAIAVPDASSTAALRSRWRQIPTEQSKETLMRATIMYGAGDVRIETVPDPKLQHPTDAIVRAMADRQALKVLVRL
jgi:hypothetical protein